MDPPHGYFTRGRMTEGVRMLDLRETIAATACRVLHDNHAHPRILIQSKRADEISETIVKGVLAWIQFLRTEVPRFWHDKTLAWVDLGPPSRFTRRKISIRQCRGCDQSLESSTDPQR